MTLSAYQNKNENKLQFQLQEIVDVNARSQKWLEMLYRPQNMNGKLSVEHYFRALSTQEKINLDIQIFNHLPEMMNVHHPDRLSINLTPISLLNESFKNNLDRLIHEELVEPNKLCIEIIEVHSMPTLSSSSLDLIEKFRALGGWIALDDFGSGFAHWDLLQMGLIDVIKVANQNLKHSSKTATFSEGLAKFAHAMGINTVLEGVETQLDFEKGKKQGFKNFQGWYFNE